MTRNENSNWIVEVRTALERSEANEDPPQLVIWKIPSDLRTTNEHYEPEYWRFGLHHSPFSVHHDGPEGFKVEVARALQFTGDRWDSFCERVVLEPKEYWEVVYHHSPHARSHTIEEIKCRLSLDALFIVVFLLYEFGTASFGPALLRVMKNPILQRYCSLLREAFSLVENQIPMELLERVVNILMIEYKDNMQEWRRGGWQIGWHIGECVNWWIFNDPLIDAKKVNEILAQRLEKQLQHADSYRGVHILDSIYRMLCGQENLEATREKLYPPRYSATELEACGVTIKGKEFTCFEDISFENGCLSVPYLQVYSETEIFLRNLVMYESLLRRGDGKYAAMCYTSFMKGLMKTREDVILLEKRGVLLVANSSHDNVVDMWKRINYHILFPLITDDFFTMMTNMRKYMKQRRNKYRFEFKKQFCSRPWIPLSYLAATIVTVATMLQTYVAIIGSNKMKPHFLPQH